MASVDQHGEWWGMVGKGGEDVGVGKDVECPLFGSVRLGYRKYVGSVLCIINRKWFDSQIIE